MIKENLARIKTRISDAAERAGRQPDDVKLICITKTATIEDIKQVIDCGITDIGESKFSDALLKYEQLGDIGKKVRWHMIGHLQTNKVKKALQVFGIIDSVDSLKLAKEIDNKAKAIGKRIDCLVEVNTSGEPSKYGITSEETYAFVKKVASLPNIHIIGLMTMAPIVKNPEEARPYFIKLRQLKEELTAKDISNTDITELSMGMTQDFEIAVEEGATMVRIGTAIFG